MKEDIKLDVLKQLGRKAPGPDNITVELLKFGGEVTLTLLHEICNTVIRFARVGQDQKNGRSQCSYKFRRNVT